MKKTKKMAEKSSPAEGQSEVLIGQELAVSLESYYTRFELLQYTPDELISKKGFRTLEKMAMTDDVISRCLSALKMMRLSAGYEIVEASEDSLDIQVADEVADNLDMIESGLRESLFSIMGSLDMGWSIHEKNWDYWTDGPWVGHARLISLRSKNPQWFNPSVDDFNNITGLVMISPPAYARKLPHEKFLIYSAQKRYENVFGTARTRSLYDWWYLKGIAKQTLAILLKKYGKETPIAEYPMTMQAADKAKLLTSLTNLATSAAMIMPEGTKLQWAKMDFSTVQGCLALIEKADQSMEKAIMGQVGSSGTSSGQPHKGGGQQGGGTGGGAGSGGAGMAADTLNMLLEFIGDDIASGPMAALIKEIVDVNYAGIQKYPKFRFKPLFEDDMTASVDAWIRAATAMVGRVPAGPPGPDGAPSSPGATGTPLVTSTPEDEQHIREILGFPSSTEKTTLRPDRYKNAPVARLAPPRAPVDPKTLPIAGYRPPTPSAPGLPANYAEGKWKPARAFTAHEKHVDFAEAVRIMGADEVLAQEAADVLRRGVEKLKVQAKKALGDSGAIKRMTMPYRSELAAVLRDGLQGVAKQAARQAKGEIKARKQATKMAEHDFGQASVEEVMKLIADRSFTMAGNVSDEVLKRVQMALYDGVKSGASYKDMVYQIEESIAPYLDLTQASELSGGRLMNVVRTNVSDAYSQARDAVFLDPELEGFVQAFQFSAVMDGDTTEWCAGMDGKIFKASNPIWDVWTPPTFYQCRSVKVPITTVDGWDGVEDDPPVEQPPAW